MKADIVSSTGVPSHMAAVLAYGGWWITGLIFWWLERRDPFVRFHAAQAIAAFGLVAALVGAFGVMAILSLSFLPAAFALFVGAAAVVWLGGVLLWGLAIWRAASGELWRIPIAADLADRLV